MRKIFIGTAAVVIILGAVVVLKQNNQTNSDLEIASDFVSCSEICAKELLADCDRVKGDLGNCEANCEYWTPGMKACVKKARECEELDLDFSRSAKDLSREAKGLRPDAEDKIAQKSSCSIIDDDYSDIATEEEKKETQFGCSGACYKYKQCAGFGQGVSETDKDYAYDSCFEECQKWSQKTLDCMAKIEINSGLDCAPLTMCALGEYKGF